MKRMNRADERFDCVFLDPPFFSSTKAGAFKIEEDTKRLLNKIRPLVNHGGVIVAVNNALFVSGADCIDSLKRLEEDGYVKLEETISVPVDFTGTAHTRRSDFPADPTPFNHPTKIAILRITSKDGKAD